MGLIFNSKGGGGAESLTLRSEGLSQHWRYTCIPHTLALKGPVSHAVRELLNGGQNIFHTKAGGEGGGRIHIWRYTDTPHTHTHTHHY